MPAAAAMTLLAAILLATPSLSAQEHSDSDELPAQLRPWLEPQAWQRDADGPILSLGESGDFDDTHVFAPCVAFFQDRFWLWYCGSRGAVDERVFRVGLTTSADGRRFAPRQAEPVYEFGDGRRSILTPTLLHGADGALRLEDGKLRMWFSAADLTDPSGLHTLHETTSRDGKTWSEPSAAQLEHAYSPTILKEGDTYKLWYSDVSGDPWTIRHATSRDGRQWQVVKEPVLKLDQQWEHTRLFYPTVVKADGVYVMWYGSYWAGPSTRTALGVAASLDGIKWHKSPHNPVFRPDPSRPWESHYTTSQSVLRMPDGSWRMWYSSRKQPPFVNKYFAINTARWAGPGGEER